MVPLSFHISGEEFSRFCAKAAKARRRKQGPLMARRIARRGAAAKWIRWYIKHKRRVPKRLLRMAEVA